MDDKMLARFMAKVRKCEKTECWLWAACVDKDGYGFFSVARKNKRAHRVAYEHYIGDIPEGLVLDHRCCNPRCVNPQHLRPVTNKRNLEIGIPGTWDKPPCAKWQLAKTHCPQGHPLEQPNLHIHKDGRKQCLICYRASKRDYARRKRAAAKLERPQPPSE